MIEILSDVAPHLTSPRNEFMRGEGKSLVIELNLPAIIILSITLSVPLPSFDFAAEKGRQYAAQKCLKLKDIESIPGSLSQQ